MFRNLRSISWFYTYLYRIRFFGKIFIMTRFTSLNIKNKIEMLKMKIIMILKKPFQWLFFSYMRIFNHIKKSMIYLKNNKQYFLYVLIIKTVSIIRILKLYYLLFVFWMNLLFIIKGIGNWLLDFAVCMIADEGSSNNTNSDSQASSSKNTITPSGSNNNNNNHSNTNSTTNTNAESSSSSHSKPTPKKYTERDMDKNCNIPRAFVELIVKDSLEYARSVPKYWTEGKELKPGQSIPITIPDDAIGNFTLEGLNDDASIKWYITKDPNGKIHLKLIDTSTNPKQVVKDVRVNAYYEKTVWEIEAELDEEDIEEDDFELEDDITEVGNNDRDNNNKGGNGGGRLV